MNFNDTMPTAMLRCYGPCATYTEHSVEPLAVATPGTNTPGCTCQRPGCPLCNDPAIVACSVCDSSRLRDVGEVNQRFQKGPRRRGLGESPTPRR